MELWIETADHALGGYIDSVEESDKGLVLRDFKSGLITVPGSDSSEVKPEYVVQLELYCGMYFEVHHRWPDTLEIVPVVGDPIAIEVDRKKCSELLHSTREALHQINSAVSLVQDGARDEAQLANVSGSNCARCEFRPVCSGYKSRILPTLNSDDEWPVDVMGEVIKTDSFSNGTSAITVRARDVVQRVRGITSGTERNPALAQLRQGSLVGIYSLKRDRVGPDLVQGPGTTIYLE